MRLRPDRTRADSHVEKMAVINLFNDLIKPTFPSPQKMGTQPTP